jgi:methylenetetrahydrofolate dehydrogenase (NADP+)/methenyltetrahydrofolate cyclohydrolase
MLFFQQEMRKNGKEVVVIGNRGEVGRRLQRILECQGMDKEDFDVEVVKRAHVIVSATGVAGLISVDMVDEGVVVIDVGYPEGDVAQVVATKARFFTPVPGGVGPMTVVMLFENLVEAAILNNHGGTTKS